MGRTPRGSRSCGIRGGPGPAVCKPGRCRTLTVPAEEAWRWKRPLPLGRGHRAFVRLLGFQLGAPGGHSSAARAARTECGQHGCSRSHLLTTTVLPLGGTWIVIVIFFFLHFFLSRFPPHNEHIKFSYTLKLSIDLPFCQLWD